MASSSSSTPSTIKLAEYLFCRLRQLGVDAIHGVPGDFNLTLLDYIEPSGLLWVGNAQELGAGYAADGYSRTKGIGSLISTFGVGELSAINAIAGAYSERAAVVHIVGIPPRPMQDSRVLVHHTFADGEFGRFARMHAPVTVAQARLWDPRLAPSQIDEVLRQCVVQSRPVYVEVPVDMVSAPVSSAGLSLPIEKFPGLDDESRNPAADAVLERIVSRIHEAKQPLIFVDGETRPMGVVEEVQALATKTRWPTWTTPFGKGLLDETQPNFHGVYSGRFDTPTVQAFFKDADLVLCFGAHFSTTNSSASSGIPPVAATISVSDTIVKIGAQEIFRDVPAKYLATRLLSLVDPSKLSRRYADDYPPDLPRDEALTFLAVPADSRDQPLTQELLWRILASFLRPGDIVMGETGTAGNGVREMALPRHCRFFAPVTWLSIGYMLPAAQGAALALRELSAAASASSSSIPKSSRTLLFVGDGSFQMTAQELGTIIRHDLDVVVFLINNAGYTIERCIHGRKQRYNDVASWRYLLAPKFFGAREDTYTASARTWAELEAVLGDERLTDGKGLRMVEIVLDPEDAPRGLLRHLLEAQKLRE